MGGNVMRGVPVTPADPTRVLFVDDDPDWHVGLQEFFRHNPEVELVACTAAVAKARAILASIPIDVVLLDVMLGDHSPSGVEAAADIHLAFPHMRIIMFSSLDSDDATFNEAFLNGAYDYIYKYELEQLPAVIKAAAQNRRSKYGERLRALMLERKRELLQDADRDLLALLAAGHSQQEIADMAHLSEDAVKKRVSRLRKRFGRQRSTRELAERCRLWGLLEG